jgi:mannose/fructose-specific phosphotransferase system component IIA
MSSSVPVRAVLLGHGDLAFGMADAVRQITGAGEEALVPLSNRGLSPDSLSQAILEQVGDQPAILFTDLHGGSCSFVARRLTQQHSGLAVISGVNLSLLLEFVMQRQLPLEELVPRLLSRGRAAIGCMPAELEANEHRPVSG